MVSFSRHIIFATLLFAPALAAPVARGSTVTVTVRGLEQEARTLGDRALELGQARRSFSDVVPRIVASSTLTPAEQDEAALKKFDIALNEYAKKTRALGELSERTKEGARELRRLFAAVEETLAVWKIKKGLVQTGSATRPLPDPRTEEALEQIVKDYEDAVTR